MTEDLQSEDVQEALDAITQDTIAVSTGPLGPVVAEIEEADGLGELDE
jgi:hypothetical protein